MLAMGWGPMGFTGMTPAIYNDLPDDYILEWLSAKRTRRGGIVPEWKLRERERDEQPIPGKSILPSKEELGIPDEAFKWRCPDRPHGPPVIYTMMFWHVWKRRGLTPEQISDKYREHMLAHGHTFNG